MTLTIAEALRATIHQEMARDASVFCLGEDIAVPGGFGGALLSPLGLEQDFRARMIDTPISETAIFGMACGAAAMGMRPIADVQYGDFLFCAMDEIVDQIAKLRYMSGGQLTMPLVMRAPVGVTGRGAQHAQNLEPYLLSCPGLKVVAPATAYDATGLLRSAIRDDDPVLMFEHSCCTAPRERAARVVRSTLPRKSRTRTSRCRAARLPYAERAATSPWWPACSCSTSHCRRQRPWRPQASPARCSTLVPCGRWTSRGSSPRRFQPAFLEPVQETPLLCAVRELRHVAHRSDRRTSNVKLSTPTCNGSTSEHPVTRRPHPTIRPRSQQILGEPQPLSQNTDIPDLQYTAMTAELRNRGLAFAACIGQPDNRIPRRR